jgi:hypothetical protein
MGVLSTKKGSGCPLPYDSIDLGLSDATHVRVRPGSLAVPANDRGEIGNLLLAAQ